MDKRVSTKPEKEGGDRHQNAWETEGRPRPHRFQQDRSQNRAGHSANVNGEVEPIENLGQQMLVSLAKLIAHMGTNARLDSTRSNRDQKESQVKERRHVPHSRDGPKIHQGQ